jgi:uncharacterized protein
LPTILDATGQELTYEPIRLLILQPTPFCNLDCDYCYLPGRTVRTRMSEAVLTRALDAVMNTGLVGPRLSLIWHSGEPLAVPMEFYDSASAIIQERMRGVDVSQAIQTNGTPIDDAWCDLFKRYDIHVGVSLDGPKSLHDLHRVDRSKRGTFDRVMRGIETLQRNEVPFVIIAVVTEDSLDRPEEIVEFFVDIGVEHVGFSIEELESANIESSILALDTDRVRSFWTRVYRKNVLLGQPLRIREFNRAFASIALNEEDTVGDKRALLGNEQARPFGIINIDCEGNISTFSPEMLGASHARFPSFLFGNVMEGELIDMLSTPLFVKVAREIADGVRLCAQSCQYFRYCGGGAPSNKLYENGTFASCETMACRHSVQIPIDVLLDDLEQHFELTQEC